MSKVLPATCVGGVVTAGGLPIPGTTLYSEGVGASSGVLILEEDVAHYIAETSPDLEATLTQVLDALQDIASALTTVCTSLTSIFAVPGAAWVPPANIPADVTSILLKVSEITAARTALTALKGSLR